MLSSFAFFSRLLLDNPTSVHLFDDLSAGEKVLALHKTFHHIGEQVKHDFFACICFYVMYPVGMFDISV